MSEATNQTAESTPARDAGRTKPIVVTSETIAQMFAPPAAASEQASNKAPEDESKDDPKADEQRKDGKKNGFQERISQLVNQRRDAEAKAEEERRARLELEDEIKRLKARAPAIEDKPRPQRAQYTSQEEYEDALGDWKADQKIAQRERQHAEAQAKAEWDDITTRFQKRQQKVMEDIADYRETLEKSDLKLPDHLHEAILVHKAGPLMAYFFAKHPSEARRFAAMRPTVALTELGELGRELLRDPEPEEAKKPAVEVSKAPPPVKPAKDSAPLSMPASNYAEYRAKRQAEKKR